METKCHLCTLVRNSDGWTVITFDKGEQNAQFFFLMKSGGPSGVAFVRNVLTADELIPFCSRDVTNINPNPSSGHGDPAVWKHAARFLVRTQGKIMHADQTNNHTSREKGWCCVQASWSCRPPGGVDRRCLVGGQARAGLEQSTIAPHDRPLQRRRLQSTPPLSAGRVNGTAKAAQHCRRCRRRLGIIRRKVPHIICTCLVQACQWQGRLRAVVDTIELSAPEQPIHALAPFPVHY